MSVECLVLDLGGSRMENTGGTFPLGSSTKQSLLVKKEMRKRLKTLWTSF